MPLIKIKDIGQRCRLALWKMTEPVDELYRPPYVDFSHYHSVVRLKEKLVEYNLLRALMPGEDLTIDHLDSGKPVVGGYAVSISHTRGWAAIIMCDDTSRRLGVDIEYFSERVNKVADRFIRPDEQSGSLRERLINWSAKETVYKALSEEDLQYFEMRLQHYVAADSGTVDVVDLKKDKTVKVNYIINNDYVLTWTE